MIVLGESQNLIKPAQVEQTQLAGTDVDPDAFSVYWLAWQRNNNLNDNIQTSNLRIVQIDRSQNCEM